MQHPVQKVLFFFLVLWLAACQKASFSNSADLRLRTTADTLHFDTVFTTTGSVSQVFKIVNDNSQGLRIDQLQLGGGGASAFKINADGRTGPSVSGIEVPAGDSIYVFVTVSINPTAANLPFVVRDSIRFTYNGNQQWVQLEAWGRNARFLRNKKITANEMWTAGLPYVLLEGLTVEEGATLSIAPGVQLYFHADAPLIVKGSLQVRGERWDSTRVVFRGDRLDEPYRDFPASFPGLVFLPSSRNNVLEYATIQNAYQALVVAQPAPVGTKLSLQQVIVDNAYDAGIVAINSSIVANNVLVSNCGKNIVLLQGGSYQFNHCTAASFSNRYLQHKDPVLFISNFLTSGGTTTVNPLSAQFRNCIFWGESGGVVKSEVEVAPRQGTQPFSVQFDNVLWRVPADPQGVTVAGTNIKNENPLFDSVNTNNRIFYFRLKAGSPAINKGTPTGLTVDLDGKSRAVGLPDLGAYEKQ